MEILTTTAITYEGMCLHYRGAFHRSELAGVAYCIKNYNWKYGLVLNQWRYMAGSTAELVLASLSTSSFLRYETEQQFSGHK